MTAIPALIAVAVLYLVLAATTPVPGAVPDFTEPITATWTMPQSRAGAVGKPITVPVVVRASRPFQTVEIAWSYAPEVFERVTFEPAGLAAGDCCPMWHAKDTGWLRLAIMCIAARHTPPYGLLGSVRVWPRQAGASLITMRSCTVDGQPSPCDVGTMIRVRQ